MALDKTEIGNIAWLARLTARPDELDQYQTDLETILGLVEQMQDVDTSDTRPLAHPLELTARLRPDEVTEVDQRDKLLSVAPAVEKGHFLVPRVIE